MDPASTRSSRAITASVGAGRPPADGGPLRIVWNHRWAHDKAPERFVHSMALLAGEDLDFTVVAMGSLERSGQKAYRRLLTQLGTRVTPRLDADRATYEAELGRADLVVSTARHDFFGVAVAEAIAAGARPVLPHRLAYPELVPAELAPELLYRGQLSDALRPLLALDRPALHRFQAATTGHVAKLAWPEVAASYDARIEQVVRGR